MFGYVLRRILYAAPIAVGVTVIVFSLVHIAPGDPISAILPDGASAEMVAEVRRQYGFDRPLPEQYVRWLWRALGGELGTSIANGRLVADELVMAVGNTLILAASAGLVACTLGCLLGAVAGLARDRFADHAASLFTIATQ
jgi:peptide/nickel transport system permease protein